MKRRRKLKLIKHLTIDFLAILKEREEKLDKMWEAAQKRWAGINIETSPYCPENQMWVINPEDWGNDET